VSPRNPPRRAQRRHPKIQPSLPDRVVTDVKTAIYRGDFFTFEQWDAQRELAELAGQRGDQTMSTRFIVCPTCEGRGTHVNPAVDGNGLTAEDMAELGDDFREDYLGGVYDVRCEECKGDRVVPACRCGQPVAPGTLIRAATDDEIDTYHRRAYEAGGEWPELEARYSACYEHLTDDEREWFDSERDSAAMTAAELRAGA
jgi:hypothetical protein